MLYIKGTKDFKLENTAVAVGKFDGFHKGHKLLIDAIESRRKEGLKAVIFTFDNHPNSVFSGKGFETIYTAEEKHIIAERLGADVLIEYPFTDETVHMEAEDFITEVLVKQVGAKFIAVGDDFRFGSGRKGNAELIKKMAESCGYEAFVTGKMTTVIPEGLDGYEPGSTVDISSTLIRHSLKCGKIAFANELLGRPYMISGTVVHGKHLGSRLLLPTINILPAEDKCLPPEGVYTTKTFVEGKWYRSITNIGVNPTIEAGTKKHAETYLEGFSGDLYDKYAEIELYRFDRPEMHFDNIESLKEQMMKDKEHALAYFSSDTEEDSIG
ncbi:MAG: riboflavin biosynthesis protein RibF [Lachnospiraceae bacterium]|nr:riboflavin biosynthesis protein RibF [Lachnospiraceae bacterium]